MPKKIGKNPKIVCSEIMPEKFSFLPEKNLIEGAIQKERVYKLSFESGENDIKELFYEQEGNVLKLNIVAGSGCRGLSLPAVDLLGYRHDLIFSVGGMNAESYGEIYHDNADFFSKTPIVNIDCRSNNERFGNVNLARPEFSVSEIIAELTEPFLGEKPDNRIADLFLTGIIAKTNNFQSANIKAETFALAAFLLSAGANREDVIKNLTEASLLFADKKKEAYLLSRLIEQFTDKRKFNAVRRWKAKWQKGDILNYLMPVSFDKRLLYLIAILSAVPALMFFEKSSLALSPVSKSREAVFFKEDSIKNGAKNTPFIVSFFSALKEEKYPFQSKKELASPQDESNKNFSETDGRSINTSLVAIKGETAPKNGVENNESGFLKKEMQNIGFPKELNIKSINIDAKIKQVGYSPEGEMAAPSDFESVGWFKYGVRPGLAGNAVMGGHLDDPSGRKAIFGNLDKLIPGDYVYVTDEYNQKLRFRIVRSEAYDAEKAPIEEIFGPSSSPHLNLVTCVGAWDAKKKSYNKRLVVFTDYDPE